MGLYRSMTLAIAAVCISFSSTMAVVAPVAARHASAPYGIPADACLVPLVAGKHYTVGDVHVEIDGTNLVATYLITDGYSSLIKTHLYVGAQPPPKSAPGDFPFKHEKVRGAIDVFVIPLAELNLVPGGCIYVAAHADVYAAVDFKPIKIKKFLETLPETADLTIGYPGGGNSYLDAIVTAGGILDGVHNDWCVDTDHEVVPGDMYHVEIRSSLVPQPTEILDFPENMDIVNFILNEDYIGRESSAYGPYTWGDVQQAIWEVIEDEVPQGDAGTDPYDQARVDEIVVDALARGEGFKPECNDIAATILRPIDADGNTAAQITVIETVLRCPAKIKKEGAWGAGPYPLEHGWGSYFRCCP